MSWEQDNTLYEFLDDAMRKAVLADSGTIVLETIEVQRLLSEDFERQESDLYNGNVEEEALKGEVNQLEEDIRQWKDLVDRMKKELRDLAKKNPVLDDALDDIIELEVNQ